MGGVSELGAAFPCDRCRLSPRLLRAIPPIGAAFLIDSAKVRNRKASISVFFRFLHMLPTVSRYL